MGQAEMTPQEAPRAVRLHAELSAHPEILDDLAAVPAFWEAGLESSVQDISLRNLLSRYAGLGGTAESEADLTREIGIPEGTLHAALFRHHRALRQWLHESPDQWDHETHTWVARVEEYKMIQRLFADPPAYFADLLDVPIFNADDPP